MNTEVETINNAAAFASVKAIQGSVEVALRRLKKQDHAGDVLAEVQKDVIVAFRRVGVSCVFQPANAGAALRGKTDAQIAHPFSNEDLRHAIDATVQQLRGGPLAQPLPDEARERLGQHLCLLLGIEHSRAALVLAVD